MAVVAVVVIGSQGCSERIVLLNDCRFVFGITSNIHVIGPLVGGAAPGACGLTWIVTVPRQVPERDDVSEGDVGRASRPHAMSDIRSSSGLQVMQHLHTFIV